MGNFCSLSDVKLRIGEGTQYEELTNIPDGASVPSGDTLTDLIIANIDKMISDALIISYDNPILLYGCQALKDIAVELVFCQLLRRREYDGIDESFNKGQYKRCEDAKRSLQAISLGEIDLVNDGQLIQSKIEYDSIFVINNNNTRKFPDA